MTESFKKRLIDAYNNLNANGFSHLGYVWIRDVKQMMEMDEAKFLKELKWLYNTEPCLILLVPSRIQENRETYVLDGRRYAKLMIRES